MIITSYRFFWYSFRKFEAIKDQEIPNLSWKLFKEKKNKKQNE